MRCRPPRRGALSVAATDGVADALGTFPVELALLFAFAAGAATAAAVMTRESVLGLPLPPLPNAKRLSPAAAPDRILTGSGVVVLQHLLKYFYPGARATRAACAPRRARLRASSPPHPERAACCARPRRGARHRHHAPNPAGLGAAAERHAARSAGRGPDARCVRFILRRPSAAHRARIPRGADARHGAGDAPPLVNAVKLYDTPSNKIIVELETVWDSNARLRLGVSFTEGGSLYAPVEVTGIRFQGVIRIIMAPMLLGPPFVGSMSFASALAPNIDFRITVLGGEVSAIPGLREALQVRTAERQSCMSCALTCTRPQEYATSLLNATFTWPTRIVVRVYARCSYKTRGAHGFASRSCRSAARATRRFCSTCCRRRRWMTCAAATTRSCPRRACGPGAAAA